MKNKDQTHLEYVTFILTHKCNLKCKLCTQYVPYYEKPLHPPLNRLKEETDALFGFARHIHRLTLSGGEILLRSDLPEFLCYLERYADRFAELRLYTNGTIVPTEQTLSALQIYKDCAYIVVDNYGPDLSRKIEEISKALQKADINHEVRDYHQDLHASGWVNLNDFQLKHDKDEAEALFSRCSIAKDLICVEYIGGVLNICAFARRCKELGIIVGPSESIDLFDDAVSMDEKRRVAAMWPEKKCLAACAFCNGRCEDSVRYLPAEQITT